MDNFSMKCVNAPLIEFILRFIINIIIEHYRNHY
jgi:hypothetical protein